MKQKCIYCGKEADSISDIFPDALTNAKFKSRIVCTVEHNNKFSDKFENSVINCFSCLLNHLDIRSSKSNKKRNCHSIIRIGDVEFEGNYSSSTVFKTNVIKSKDGTHLLGPRRFFDNNPRKEFDKCSIEYIYIFNFSFLYEESIFRLAAKIAYEFLASVYKFRNFKENNFRDIKDFIVNGNKENIVDIIDDNEVFKLFNNGSIEKFSHFVYIHFFNNKVYGYVCFFGLIIYKVLISTNFTNEKYNNSILYLPYKKEACTFTNNDDLQRYAEQVPVSDGLNGLIVKNNIVLLRMAVSNSLNGNEKINMKHSSELVQKRTEDAFNTIIINKRLICEFINENNLLFEENIKLMISTKDILIFCYFLVLYNLYINDSYLEIDKEISDSLESVSTYRDGIKTIFAKKISYYSKIFKTHISYILHSVIVLLEK